MIQWRIYCRVHMHAEIDSGYYEDVYVTTYMLEKRKRERKRKKEREKDKAFDCLDHARVRPGLRKRRFQTYPRAF